MNTYTLTLTGDATVYNVTPEGEVLDQCNYYQLPQEQKVVGILGYDLVNVFILSYMQNTLGISTLATYQVIDNSIRFSFLATVDNHVATFHEIKAHRHGELDLYHVDCVVELNISKEISFTLNKGKLDANV